MAVLRYKDENGNYHDLVGINVQNEVVQTTGQSTTAVMSQKAVSDLIPAQASSSNQLADKDFVNSSVSTATATYQGSYNLVSDLSLTTQASHGQIEDALGGEISGADNNDYAFVQIPTSDSTPTEIAAVERYKFNGTRWSFEYTLNNSGFTAAQWAAVNSGITSGLVAKINALSGNPQSSIASLFGMDSSGNFQNISAANLASVLGGVQIRQMSDLEDITWPLGASIQYNADRMVFSIVRETDTVGIQFKLDFSDFKLQWRYRWPSVTQWKDF